MFGYIMAWGTFIAINILCPYVGIEGLTPTYIIPYSKQTTIIVIIIPFAVESGCGAKLLHALNKMKH